VHLACDDAKIFLTSEFSFLLFSNPTYKTKTGTAYRWETTNSKPPGPIRVLGQSETGSSSLLHNREESSLAGLGFAVPFTRLSKLAKMLGQNHFAQPNWHVFIFLHPILICRLSTGCLPLTLLLLVFLVLWILATLHESLRP